MRRDFSGKKILISRTDNIGDVMLSLPVAGFLKQFYPGCKIYFLGKSYTKILIESCIYVDHFVDVSDFLKWKYNKVDIDLIIHLFPNKEIASKAKNLKIPHRLGTWNRVFHWFSCNILSNLSRKNSDFHEAILNIKLLKPITGEVDIKFEDLSGLSGFQPNIKLDQKWFQLLDPKKIKVIIHPKSKGSAREWGLDNFGNLVEKLLKNGKFQIFLSGTLDEGKQMRAWTDTFPELVDLTGKMDLSQFIAFIHTCDVLVAASTGPLHIASALGKRAIGIFAPMKPIHPGRWAPLGYNARSLVTNKDCSDCRKTSDCHCIREIQIDSVLNAMD